MFQTTNQIYYIAYELWLAILLTIYWLYLMNNLYIYAHIICILIIIIIIIYMVGGFNPSEKYESQWKGLSHTLWKTKFMFQTTNQIYYKVYELWLVILLTIYWLYLMNNLYIYIHTYYMYTHYIIYIYLVGGFNTSEKYESSYKWVNQLILWP